VTVSAEQVAAAGRAAWPDVALGEDRIREHLVGREAIEVAHLGDLYLAFALAEGNEAAVRVFEDKFIPQIDHALRRVRMPAGTADEVKQAMRVELLADRKIVDYAGRGELAAWLRISATRKAFKIAKRGAREQSLDDALLEHWPAGAPDPRTDHLRARYTAELKTAIREAFAALEVRQRNLLRQHILDELTIDDLAKLYRVHRATCARWLADARAELGKTVRKRLIGALGASGDELDSLLRFLDSDIELSISRILVSRS
jgi:RNA polymerase sigma-70 factor (ECF subfamily)